MRLDSRARIVENAIAERVNKTIKGEFTTEQQIHFKDVETAKNAIKTNIEYYNKRRFNFGYSVRGYGDARATDMAHQGELNVGQLVRQQFATAAVNLNQSSQALNAIIQSAAQIGRRSLIDLIG